MKNMTNLVIGNTSQLAPYFPDDFEKISSRNIDFEKYKDSHFDTVYLCFAEQRTFSDEEINTFYDINVHYTYNLLYFFKDRANCIIVYGTSELWNRYEGGINIHMPFNFYPTHYINSKKAMVKMVEFFRNELYSYAQIYIVHPFNFNSIYRKEGFLFSKIFDSIINKKKIEIGNTYFYRDLIHPKYVVEKSLTAEDDIIVGSGLLINVNSFIRDLYKNSDMIYENYVTENLDHNLRNKRDEYYLSSKNVNYSYNNLLKDTLNDIIKKEKK